MLFSWTMSATASNVIFPEWISLSIVLNLQLNNIICICDTVIDWQFFVFYFKYPSIASSSAILAQHTPCMPPALHAPPPTTANCEEDTSSVACGSAKLQGRRSSCPQVEPPAPQSGSLRSASTSLIGTFSYASFLHIELGAFSDRPFLDCWFYYLVFWWESCPDSFYLQAVHN